MSKSPQQRPHTADPSAGQFAQYGRGDRERETGAKKTHNVNAAQGVSSSVLGINACTVWYAVSLQTAILCLLLIVLIKERIRYCTLYIS